MAPGSDVKLRWRLVEEDRGDGTVGGGGGGGGGASGWGGQRALFDSEDLVEHHVGTGEFRGLEFLHVNARTIINEVPVSARLPFRYTINAYRGCSHACTYCFARPTHEYLGLGIGEDFERRIVVKVNAVERLRAEFAARRWGGHHIAMGTNTDPDQHCEGKYHLTRGVIEVLAEAANPFSIPTKSTLILRDLSLLAEAAQCSEVRTSLSIATLDPSIWRLTEPGTPHPRRRVEAVRKLNQAGVPCGVLVAPILPGLSDREDHLAEVVEACVGAGATSVSPVALHLRAGVREHFLAQLAQTHPQLAADYQRRYRGAYLPAEEQRKLTERVQRLVARARGHDESAVRRATGHEGFPDGTGGGRPASASGRFGAGSPVHSSGSAPRAGDGQLSFELPGGS